MASFTNNHSVPRAASPFRILIAGGGLAGLAVAIALRDIGHDVTILERMPVISEVKKKS